MGLKRNIESILKYENLINNIWDEELIAVPRTYPDSKKPLPNSQNQPRPNNPDEIRESPIRKV